MVSSAAACGLWRERDIPALGADTLTFFRGALSCYKYTKFKYYKGLKLKSKSHFYGRAAAYEVLANRLSALLRPKKF
jgi:hypothetical protein